jgi:alpha-glucosidase
MIVRAVAVRQTGVVLIAASALCACLPSSPTTLGGFKVSWSTKTPSLSINASDGRELLSTSGPVLESQTTTASWQEMYGAYLVTETPAPWYEPTGMSLQSGSDKQLTFQVTQSNGHRGTIQITSPLSGELALTFSTDGQNRVKTSFACAPNDHFLGFGAQTDAIDHHGHLIPIWTSEPGIGKTDDDSNVNNPEWFFIGARHQASYPLPEFLSGRGFDFVADTTRRAIFDLCQADPTKWSIENWDSSVTLRVYDGPSPAQAVERMTADLGRQPLANDLVLAPWNDAIFGSANVRNVASELRAAHIPSSVIWTEDFRGGSFTGDAYRIKEEWDVDPTLYPDIQQLATDLHNEGFRFFAYHNTFLTSGTNILAEAESPDVLIQQKSGGDYFFQGSDFVPVSMVDLTNPTGVAFVKSWLQNYASYGFDGWMADYGEWLPVDAKLFNGADAEAYHNTYPEAYHQLDAQVFASLTTDPNTRTYFTRSGTLRSCVNQPVVWGGDQLTTFDQNDGFPTALMRGLNLGLAGVAIYGSDIAGYQNDGGPPSTEELFFRWTTMGALSTVMRTHHGVEAALNWNFASDAASTAHFARWAQFHAQLWPYLKTAAQEAFSHGMPIMRVLPLMFPDDTNVWTMTDEYFFGDSLLVAPVLVQGATSRGVYLPTGTWLPYWGGAPLSGPATVTVQLPLTEIGLWAPAGSIIPTIPPLDTLMPAAAPLVTLSQVQNQRILKVFGGASGQWTDIDGTQYTLTSTPEVPASVTVGGTALPSCSTDAMPCADIDTTNRIATVKGAGLTSVALGGSTLTVKGSLQVNEIDYRF